jgi:hypothetical protein
MEIYKHMNKICTSIEQSKKLIKLGIDVSTADMYRWYSGRRYYIESMDDDDFNEESDIPAWSLTALIGLMPERIKIGEELSFCLASKKSSTGFSFDYNLNGSTFVKDNPLDAAFEMVVWLKENKKI